MRLGRRMALCLALVGLLAPALSAQAPKKRHIAPQAAEREGRAELEGLILRLMQMPPERREQVLRDNPRIRRLPPAARRRIEQRLREIDRMPERRKRLLVERYELFQRLSPEGREQAREAYRRWSRLPAPRRSAVTRAVRRLRAAEPAERERMMGSERYHSLFGEAERELIGEILELSARD